MVQNYEEISIYTTFEMLKSKKLCIMHYEL